MSKITRSELDTYAKNNTLLERYKQPIYHAIKYHIRVIEISYSVVGLINPHAYT